MSGYELKPAKTPVCLTGIDSAKKDRAKSKNENSWKKLKIDTARPSLKTLRLSRWFVTNQKAKKWDRKRLDQLHIAIIVLLFIVYVCHIITSPLLKIVQLEALITALTMIEILCLVASAICWGVMCRNNASMSAAKLMFAKKNINTYVYVFWIARSLVM